MLISQVLVRNYFCDILRLKLIKRTKKFPKLRSARQLKMALHFRRADEHGGSS